MKKIKYVFLFLSFNLASQDTTSNNFIVDSNTSYISYQGKHILHDWVGINNNVKGILVIEDAKASKIAISASVKDFDSGNGNRDSNMLEILEVIKFPKIEYYSNRISLDKDKILFSGNINFHGISRDLNITSEIKKIKNKLVLSGEFNFSLVDHNVKLPSFMMRSINKDVLIKYQLLFNKIDN